MALHTALASLLGLALAGFAPAAAAADALPLPKVASGSLTRLAALPSRFVAARDVDVWIPAGYPPGQRFGVLYMHDGQMLFDATTTWNHQAWAVDATLTRLMQEGRVPPTMVVGISSIAALRHAEYYPEKFLAHVAEPLRGRFIAEDLNGRPQADAYLRFLVEELKPEIDRRFPTLPDAAHTTVMGSSMGGMISIYAMNEYPGVFGAAGGLSTHWPGLRVPNAALPLAAFEYLRDHLADPAGHRLYMDRGTTTLDALYAPYQPFVDELVRERGYTAANSLSRVFDGEGHNEVAWARRLEIPLTFLLGGAPTK